jgi:hypothetical protein
MFCIPHMIHQDLAVESMWQMSEINGFPGGVGNEVCMVYVLINRGADQSTMGYFDNFKNKFFK